MSSFKSKLSRHAKRQKIMSGLPRDHQVTVVVWEAIILYFLCCITTSLSFTPPIFLMLLNGAGGVAHKNN